MLSRPFFRGAGSVGVLSIAVRSAGGAVARGFFSSSQPRQRQLVLNALHQALLTVMRRF